MLVDKCNAFMCWWIIANHVIYNLNRTREGKRKDCVGSNGGGFFGSLLARSLPGMAEWSGIH